LVSVQVGDADTSAKVRNSIFASFIRHS
jgi:hypothetical protein